MTLLAGLHGPIAILLLCALLFVEESGIPVPLVPGDVVLIMAGILIANGSISPWMYFPVALAAVLGGVLVGYTWSRTLGAAGMQALAERLRAGGAMRRASARLRDMGALRIMGSRLFPGLRIYTTLVAGAAGVDLRVFLLGVIPAILLWLVGFTLLGVVLGVPAVALLNRVQHLALTGVALLIMGVVTYFGIRHIPAAEREENALTHVPATLRLALSIGIDLAIAISIASGITEFIHDVFGIPDPDGVIELGLMFAVIVLSYTLATRRTVGGTAGETLLNVRYALWMPWPRS